MATDTDPSDTSDPGDASGAADASNATDQRSTGLSGRLRTRNTARETAELVGIGLVGLLAAFMLGFILLYWFREFPYVELLYTEFRIAGRLLDGVLGTNVFKHPFMWQSLSTGVLIGIVAPLVGSFLVHRQMALIGETLAHAAFAGVAISLVFNSLTGWDGSILVGALVIGVLGALIVQWLADRTDTYGDVPIAIMLSGSFALGTLLISAGRGQTNFSIESLLYGSIAVVTPDGTRLMGLLSVVVVLAVAVNYKQLLFITFDEQAARVAQLPVDRYNTLLVVMTAVVVVGAMQVLGVILVAAMLVVPVAAASQVARSFRETVYLSILIGQAAVLAGFAVSVSLSLPAGGSIVMAAIGIYLAAIGLSKSGVTAISTH
ncbi:metal ABC transporter permease [Halonotius sp. F2-221B]|uniref:metal ABC transporter permease n=1 Tax=Halonotius sp. F2-221B TaxID=2731620 RepID=UPI00398A549E